MRGSGLRRAVASAVAALGLYGGWAFVANLEHGVGRAARAAGAQATSSLLLTLLVSGLMERLFRIPRRPWARVALAVSGSVSTSIALTLGVHLLAGTAELARTVVPVVLGGGAFALAYSLNLLRLTRPSGGA